MKQEDLLTLIRKGESERVEFKRGPTKRLDQEIAAFANADGGTLLIGIENDGTIAGTDIQAAQESIASQVQAIIPSPHLTLHTVVLDEKKVLVVEVKKSEHLCSIGGVVYIRIGTSIRPLSVQEILMLSSEMGTISWDESALIPRDAARDQYIDWFFETMEKSRGKKISLKDRERYLRSIRAIRQDRLTNSGTLYFTDVTDYLPFVRIRIIRIEEGEPIASREYEGPVWKTIESVYTDLIGELGRTEVIIGARRLKIEEYPPRALREVIINAVAHRNYTIQADIRIFIYKDKIEIRSPGGLLPGVNLNDPEHIPRNPSLSHLLYDTGFIERYGYGIRMVHDEVKKHSRCTIQFHSTTGGFIAIFRKTLPSDLDPKDREILNHLQIHKKSGELALTIGISKPTLLRRLKHLEEMKLIRKEGSGAHTRYIAASAQNQ